MGFFYGVHNHYLWLWFQLGIIGLVSYLMLIGQLLITARRAIEHTSDETARYLIAFIYAVCAMSVAVFFTLLSKPAIYIWIYIGLTMRMAAMAMQTAQQDARDNRRDPSIISTAPVADRAGAREPATRAASHSRASGRRL
jgi:O-antigen ligase